MQNDMFLIIDWIILTVIDLKKNEMIINTYDNKVFKSN